MLGLHDPLSHSNTFRFILIFILECKPIRRLVRCIACATHAKPCREHLAWGY